MSTPPVSAAPPLSTGELCVITTHINADFDAVASMVAAQKLYPDAQVVFPGSQDHALRSFFIDAMAYLLNLADINTIDLSQVGRLVIVDTRQPSRLGPFQTILAKPDLDIHIFDHHPPLSDDIRGSHEVIAETGATVTLLTEIIAVQKIPLTPDEATILALGLYEDTGAFTYSTTTPRDLTAAAFLLKQGAELKTVSDLTRRELTSDQIALLNDMIDAAKSYRINGVDILISTIFSDDYIPDVAALVHKMLKMENYKAIFLLGLMENKIHIIGRSRTAAVDVGRILKKMGGGGHAAAAAATLKKQTLAQGEQTLLALLRQSIQSPQTARHIMSSPALSVIRDTTCEKARELLNRYSVNALLVMEKSGPVHRLAGYITRQVIEKAHYHQLSHLPVSDYMDSEVVTVDAAADLTEIQKRVIEKKQRILPVMDKNRVVGVITRTDLLNILIETPQQNRLPTLETALDNTNTRTRDITNVLKERATPKIITYLNEIGRIAHELGYRAFVVGGFVRDLFLYRPNEDIDIVIEGDGILTAKALAQKFEGRVHTHAKFGTAVVVLPDDFKIDVATARMEYYTYPAALPEVAMSSIKLDLFRRDFTINTLALQITPDHFGTLIDFFAARKDIKEKAVRVLHNLSFVEDPTRVFRAIRFEQRFGFKIGKVTSDLIRNAVRMAFFDRLSGKRVFTELQHILEEKNPARAVKRMHEFDLLKVIHPSIHYNNTLDNLFKELSDVLAWYNLSFLDEPCRQWIAHFLILIKQIKRRSAYEICQRLELPPRLRVYFTTARFKANNTLHWLESQSELSNSTLYKALSDFELELLLYMMATTTNARVKQGISLFLNELRIVTGKINGNDLIALNIPTGPHYKEILDAALYARLDGKIKSREDELAFASHYYQNPPS